MIVLASIFGFGCLVTALAGLGVLFAYGALEPDAGGHPKSRDEDVEEGNRIGGQEVQ